MNLYHDIYHHQVTLLAQISRLSCHLSQSSNAPDRSSRLHPMSVQSCHRYVLLGWPTLSHLCERVHKRTSFMHSSLLFQQHSTRLVCLNWIILEIGGKWSYSCCFMGNLFINIAYSILIQFPSNFSLYV